MNSRNLVQQNSAKICMLGIISLMCSFIIWKVLAPTTILPVVTSVTNLTLNQVYPGIGAELIYKEKSKKWVVAAHLFKTRQKWPHNTYQPGIQFPNKTEVSTANTLNYTLGLPLYWTLLGTIFFMSKRFFIKPLLLGTVAVLLCTMTAYALAVNYSLLTLFSQEVMLRGYTESQYIVVPPQLNEYVIKLFKAITDFVGLLATIVLPSFLCVLFFANNRGEESSLPDAHN